MDRIADFVPERRGNGRISGDYLFPFFLNPDA